MSLKAKWDGISRQIPLKIYADFLRSGFKTNRYIWYDRR